MNLRRTEQGGWLRLLREWQSPEEFKNTLDRLEVTQDDYLLTDPRAGYYRDAFSAHAFSSVVGADSVRLVAEERPDLQIRLTGAELSFEVTEADTPGRKRGAEVQARRKRRTPGQAFVEPLPYEDWLTPEQADVALRAAAKRKDRNVYDPKWGLIIFLNPIEFGAHQQAIEDLMAEATATARNRFASVWVLWKGVGYNTWRDGKAGGGKFARSRVDDGNDRGS